MFKHSGSFFLTAGASLLLAAAPLANAAGIYAGIGETSESRTALSLEVDHIYPLDGVMDNLSLRLGAGMLFLNEAHRDNNYALTLTPAFRYTWQTSGWKPFFEAGIGASLFNDTHHGDKSLSTAFLFEDRLAFGWQAPSGLELGISAKHYSNAGIKEPNTGMEVYSLTVRHPF